MLLGEFHKNYNFPDQHGHFAAYGGVFVSETLIHALDELKDAYNFYRKDQSFINEFEKEFKYFVGRPSPIYFAERLTNEIGGAKIYFKRRLKSYWSAQDKQYSWSSIISKAYGKKELLLKLEQDNMVLLQLLLLQNIIWNALSLWAKRM